MTFQNNGGGTGTYCIILSCRNQVQFDLILPLKERRPDCWQLCLTVCGIRNGLWQRSFYHCVAGAVRGDLRFGEMKGPGFILMTGRCIPVLPPLEPLLI